MNTEKFKNYVLERKIKVVLLVICSFIVLAFVNQILPKDLQISFIDVGQGDCTLITIPSNKRILIDGGGNKDSDKYDIGKNVLLPYLLNHNIKKLDIIIISHFDSDHCQRTFVCDGKHRSKKCNNRKTI